MYLVGVLEVTGSVATNYETEIPNRMRHVLCTFFTLNCSFYPSTMSVLVPYPRETPAFGMWGRFDVIRRLT